MRRDKLVLANALPLTPCALLNYKRHWVFEADRLETIAQATSASQGRVDSMRSITKLVLFHRDDHPVSTAIRSTEHSWQESDLMQANDAVCMRRSAFARI